MDEYIEKANRLAAINQKIGFAIWQIQQLERCSVQYLFLLTEAKRGMGDKAANERLEELFSKSFGNIINKIKKAGLLSQDLEQRFDVLRIERNWLVHESRAQSNKIIHSDKMTEKNIQRVEAMADESKTLLFEIGVLAEQHVKKLGISQEKIDDETNRLLEQLHGPNAT